jgi:gamma-glutamylcyclotransferase (GGCT)/AIG2-like uncharacterized protein YtfP
MVKSPSGRGSSIRGELYEVDDGALAALDRLEGVPHLYQRCFSALKDDNEPAETYLFTRPIGQAPRIAQSDWRKYNASHAH